MISEPAPSHPAPNMPSCAMFSIAMFFAMYSIPSLAADPPRLSWIPTLINQGLENFVPRGKSEDSLCTKHGKVYELHLRNLTLWAVQMVDATSRGPSGVLTGNSYQFGDFDECIKVHEPIHDIRGKYVVVRFTFVQDDFNDGTSKKASSVFKYPQPHASTWEVFQATNDRRIVERNTLHWALCIPESCGDSEIESSLQSVISPIALSFAMHINASVEPLFTYSRRSFTASEDTALHIFVAVTFIMVSMVVTGTLRELKNGNISPENDNFSWLVEMSIVSNWRKLVKCESQEFPSISGMKSLSMFMIIFGHRWMVTTFSPIFNQEENELVVGDLLHTLVTNGALVVNTFLVITGFLTFSKIVKDIGNDKSINVFRFIYHRWIRITPLYAYVMVIAVVVYPRLSTGGPLGRSVIWDCKCSSATAWWTQLLYVNNYVQVTEQCLIPSWYLAMDMQLYIVCAICGYVMWVHKSTGLALLYTLTASSIILPGIVVFQKNYNGVYLFYFDDFRKLFSTPEFEETYMYTHNRASPYIIGMMAAYLYHQIKSTKHNLSKFLIWTILISALVVHLVTWLGAWVFYLPERPYYLIEHVFYAIFHRIGWSLAICVYIICDKLTYLGPLKQTIGARIFRPLSTLSYAALLIHTPIQLLLAGLQRSPPYSNTVLVVWMSCGDIVFSYLAALLLHLFIEAPLARLKDLRIRHIFGFIASTNHEALSNKKSLE
ncbi:hypothetical protein GE061_001312 [Apolygus lucorum]|uniref:Nose resistant-to-fluoxetine protein N-terminal domain-containing protein n=1 Tax=Apolygus lucorum TaxID=248454 RepID=A0A6A4IWE5_APOLU|nr:hypothetical protein GE061_001312 [Apolygus lucorum]